MKKATIEQMDNGYLLIFEGEKVSRLVENKLRKALQHITTFMLLEDEVKNVLAKKEEART